MPQKPPTHGRSSTTVVRIRVPVFVSLLFLSSILVGEASPIKETVKGHYWGTQYMTHPPGAKRILSPVFLPKREGQIGQKAASHQLASDMGVHTSQLVQEFVSMTKEGVRWYHRKWQPNKRNGFPTTMIPDVAVVSFGFPFKSGIAQKALQIPNNNLPSL